MRINTFHWKQLSGMQRSWVRYYDTSLKVPDSMSDKAIGIFNSSHFFRSNMVLGFDYGYVYISVHDF
jgi:hypothetical protein